MAVWKRASGWTRMFRKRLAEALRDEEPQPIVNVEQLVVAERDSPVTDGAAPAAPEAPTLTLVKIPAVPGKILRDRGKGRVSPTSDWRVALTARAIGA